MSAANTPAQHEEAARFFDRTSADYREKYSTASRFHHYFFNERLAKATAGLDLRDADVLDIGSGTGALYDHLEDRAPGMRFHATDVSAGMLAQSRVAVERRFVGHAYEHPFPTRQFDAIFMLGVTTYLSPVELDRNLAFIAASLRPSGRAIITFTNAHALDHWSRSAVRSVAGVLGAKDKVLGSGLRLHAYGAGEAAAIVGRVLEVERLELLNHSVFPLNRLLPGPSVSLARRLGRVDGTPAWLRWLSSDLLFVARSQATRPL